ncbi:hypothetical protein TNCV_849111 [Trichonephila clavipes]|uniref:Uncharacterized protein n=1 Tax=Trichonephila clavipes TaxID=2585209 RepID=A0A8X6RHD8_TRICX|nr:hypothetical protein TNCV_849111 [Trichonephila clavipes]
MNMKRKENFQMLPKELHQPKISSYKCTTRFSSPCQKDTRRKKLNLLFVDYQRCHEFVPSTTKDPPCRGEMHVKSVKSSNVLLLSGGVVKRGQLKYRPRHLIMVQTYEVRLEKPSCS